MDLKVIKIVNRSTTIVINGGKGAGIRNGERFLIYALGENISDPDTGESLGQLEIVKGIGVVCSVQEKMATLKNTTKTVMDERSTISRLMGDKETKERFRDIEVFFEDVNIGDFVKKI